MPVFDLHLHTRSFSDCSFIDPPDLVRHAAAAGLDGIALTEHGARWPDDRFDELRRLADPAGLVLINGQEALASSPGGMEGEFLIYGLRRSLVGTHSAAELAEIVGGEGGIMIAAHPYRISREGKYHYYGAGDRIRDLRLDAVELYHPDHNEVALSKIRRIMKERGLPGTGSSDAHKIFDVGRCVTIFENPVQGEEDFIREIRAGRVYGEKRRTRE
ncbi:MAG TPA: PHP domain-containing protein [Thermodesulfobacteriota bacterium]|nr:PHP domain-containing protein [Thermodesulfobacteriota bacterium]